MTDLRAAKERFRSHLTRNPWVKKWPSRKEMLQGQDPAEFPQVELNQRLRRYIAVRHGFSASFDYRVKPTLIARSRFGSSATAFWELADPVSVSDRASTKAIQFLEDATQLLVKEAKARFVDVVVQRSLVINPGHLRHTVWGSGLQYHLRDLMIQKRQVEFDKALAESRGEGKSGAFPVLFDTLRAAAYSLHAPGLEAAVLVHQIMAAAKDLPSDLLEGATVSEVEKMARRVASWTCARYRPASTNRIEVLDAAALEVARRHDTRLIDTWQHMRSDIAAAAGVSRKTVDRYWSSVTDKLIGAGRAEETK